MTLSVGTNLGLLSGGAQGENHYIEFMRLLRGVDGLVMLSVLDKDLATPPASPANGARYLIAPGATGAWAGKSGQIARYSTNIPAWEFYVPREGWLTHVDDENAFYKHTGTAWELTLGPPATGWRSGVGLAWRGEFGTETITTQQLAEHFKALIDDLLLIGILKP